MSIIIKINFGERVLQVYSQNGIRVYEWEIKDEFMAEYGEPVASSNNGEYIVMKQPLKFLIAQLKTKELANYDLESAPSELIREAYKFSIIKVTPFGLVFVKKIDIQDQIQSVLDTYLTAPQQQKFRENNCLLYTSPSPRDRQKSRMPSSA